MPIITQVVDTKLNYPDTCHCRVQIHKG